MSISSLDTCVSSDLIFEPTDYHSDNQPLRQRQGNFHENLRDPQTPTEARR